MRQKPSRGAPCRAVPDRDVPNEPSRACRRSQAKCDCDMCRDVRQVSIFLSSRHVGVASPPSASTSSRRRISSRSRAWASARRPGAAASCGALFAGLPAELAVEDARGATGWPSTLATRGCSRTFRAPEHFRFVALLVTICNRGSHCEHVCVPSTPPACLPLCVAPEPPLLSFLRMMPLQR